jgi:hypothetical protein
MADAAKKKVKFVGGTGEHRRTGSVTVPDAGVTLNRDEPIAVNHELSKELLSGDSARFKGLKFEDATSDEPRSKASRATAGDTGGPGGSTAPDGDSGPNRP